MQNIEVKICFEFSIKCLSNMAISMAAWLSNIKHVFKNKNVYQQLKITNLKTKFHEITKPSLRTCVH